LKQQFDLEEKNGRAPRDPITNESVTLEDYVSIFQELPFWVEQNLHTKQARKWMKHYLSTYLSPKQLGECLMQSVRQINPIAEWASENDHGIFVFDRTSRRVTFNLREEITDSDLDQLRRVKGVRWAKECQDRRGPLFPSNVSVCVDAVEDQDLMSSLKKLWRAPPFYGTPLVIFQMLNPPIPRSERTAEQYLFAQRWWENHERQLREEFLPLYPQVEAMFVDLPIRQGRRLDTLSLVALVPLKGYIPKEDEELPKEFGGLQIDVQSAVNRLLLSTRAHEQATNPKEPSSYIGQGIGDRTSAGTIGAVVERGGKQFGLTNGHVAADGCGVGRELSAPAEADKPSYLPNYGHTFKMVDGSHIRATVKETYIDAALVRCTGTTKPKKTIACSSPCFVLRTTHGRNVIPYLQSNRVCADRTTLANSTLTYFGRTSGPVEVKHVASHTGLVKTVTCFEKNQTTWVDQIIFDTTDIEKREGFGICWRRCGENGGVLEGVTPLAARN